MTPAQLQTLKAYILADATLQELALTGQYQPVANAMNLQAAPDFIVWKTSVTQDEIMQNGFDWTQVDNQTVGKARIWEWMFKNLSVSINPSKTNVRAGIDEAWKGTAAMLAVRAAVYVHCKRVATVFEKLIAVGTGSDASPATMGAEGPMTSTDVGDALSA